MPRLAPVVVNFGSLAESYLLACRAEGKSPYTVSWYRQKLRAFARRLQLHEQAGRVAVAEQAIEQARCGRIGEKACAAGASAHRDGGGRDE